MLNKLFKVPEVASYLGMSEDHIYRLIAAGTIPSLKISGAVRVSEAQLAKYVQDSTRGQEAEEVTK